MNLDTLAALLNQHGKSSFVYWDRDSGVQNLQGVRKITAHTDANRLFVKCEEQLVNFTRTTEFNFEPFQVRQVIPFGEGVSVLFDPVITAEATNPEATALSNQYQFYFDDYQSANKFYSELIK